MATLQAESQSVRNIFINEYIIPDFQRKYSWNTGNCEKLLEDFLAFYHGHPDAADQYFLGNIVVHPGNEGGDTPQLHVIDGQQRLITLLLLIKSLFKRSGENKALEECLWKKHPLSAEVLRGELRVRTCVIEGDEMNFKAAVMADGEISDIKKSLFHENLRWFDENIANRIPGTAEDLGKFIRFLLDRVMLLPIKCEAQQQALDIFQTINDRGMKLDDSDIFKVQLYRTLETDDAKNDFIARWNELGENDPDRAMDLFRIYMYVLRAYSESPSETERALRAYFGNKKWALLQNCDKVMSDIELIDAADRWASGKMWWKILAFCPNRYAKYPLFVFMHEHGRANDGVYSLDGGKVREFDLLMEKTARYCFIKGVVYNDLRKVRDAIFGICAAIAKREEDYLRHYADGITQEERNEFYTKIKTSFSSRYARGLVLIGASLNEKQTEESMVKFLSYKKWDIEHILPKNWRGHYYGNWDESTSKDALEKLGNLMPLEKKINISASNLFFAEKQKHYRKSQVRDALHLGALSVGYEVADDFQLSPSSASQKAPGWEWTLDDFNKRHDEIIGRLDKFFRQD